MEISHRQKSIKTAWNSKLESKFIGKRFGRLIVLQRDVNAQHTGASVWICECDCGKQKSIRGYCLTRGQLSCGCVIKERGHEFRLKNAIKGNNHPRWNGGKRITRTGYVQIRNPESNSPYYVLEHRYKKEKQIGRKLYPHETVHHINGIKSDNRLENLELWSSLHPSGQRVEDKLLWAKHIIELYER